MHNQKSVSVKVPDQNKKQQIQQLEIWPPMITFVNAIHSKLSPKSINWVKGELEHKLSKSKNVIEYFLHIEKELESIILIIDQNIGVISIDSLDLSKIDTGLRTIHESEQHWNNEEKQIYQNVKQLMLWIKLKRYNQDIDIFLKEDNESSDFSLIENYLNFIPKLIPALDNAKFLYKENFLNDINNLLAGLQKIIKTLRNKNDYSNRALLEMENIDQWVNDTNIEQAVKDLYVDVNSSKNNVSPKEVWDSSNSLSDQYVLNDEKLEKLKEVLLGIAKALKVEKGKKISEQQLLQGNKAAYSLLRKRGRFSLFELCLLYEKKDILRPIIEILNKSTFDPQKMRPSFFLDGSIFKPHNQQVWSYVLSWGKGANYLQASNKHYFKRLWSELPKQPDDANSKEYKEWAEKQKNLKASEQDVQEKLGFAIKNHIEAECIDHITKLFVLEQRHDILEPINQYYEALYKEFTAEELKQNLKLEDLEIQYDKKVQRYNNDKPLFSFAKSTSEELKTSTLNLRLGNLSESGYRAELLSIFTDPKDKSQYNLWALITEYRAEYTKQYNKCWQKINNIANKPGKKPKNLVQNIKNMLQDYRSVVKFFEEVLHRLIALNPGEIDNNVSVLVQLIESLVKKESFFAGVKVMQSQVLNILKDATAINAIQSIFHKKEYDRYRTPMVFLVNCVRNMVSLPSSDIEKLSNIIEKMIESLTPVIKNKLKEENSSLKSIFMLLKPFIKMLPKLSPVIAGFSSTINKVFKDGGYAESYSRNEHTWRSFIHFINQEIRSNHQETVKNFTDAFKIILNEIINNNSKDLPKDIAMLAFSAFADVPPAKIDQISAFLATQLLKCFISIADDKKVLKQLEQVNNLYIHQAVEDPEGDLALKVQNSRDHKLNEILSNIIGPNFFEDIPNDIANEVITFFDCIMQNTRIHFKTLNVDHDRELARMEKIFCNNKQGRETETISIDLDLKNQILIKCKNHCKIGIKNNPQPYEQTLRFRINLDISVPLIELNIDATLFAFEEFNKDNAQLWTNLHSLNTLVISTVLEKKLNSYSKSYLQVQVSELSDFLNNIRNSCKYLSILDLSGLEVKNCLISEFLPNDLKLAAFTFPRMFNFNIQDLSTFVENTEIPIIDLSAIANWISQENLKDLMKAATQNKRLQTLKLPLIKQEEKRYYKFDPIDLSEYNSSVSIENLINSLPSKKSDVPSRCYIKESLQYFSKNTELKYDRKFAFLHLNVVDVTEKRFTALHFLSSRRFWLDKQVVSKLIQSYAPMNNEEMNNEEMNNELAVQNVQSLFDECYKLAEANFKKWHEETILPKIKEIYNEYNKDQYKNLRAEEKIEEDFQFYIQMKLSEVQDGKDQDHLYDKMRNFIESVKQKMQSIKSASQQSAEAINVDPLNPEKKEKSGHNEPSVVVLTDEDSTRLEAEQRNMMKIEDFTDRDSLLDVPIAESLVKIDDNNNWNQRIKHLQEEKTKITGLIQQIKDLILKFNEELLDEKRMIDYQPGRHQHIMKQKEQCRASINKYNKDCQALEREIFDTNKAQIIEKVKAEYSDIEKDPYSRLYSLKQLQRIAADLQQVKAMPALKVRYNEWKELVSQGKDAEKLEVEQRKEMKIENFKENMESSFHVPSFAKDDAAYFISRIEILEKRKTDIKNNNINPTIALISQFNAELLDPKYLIDGLERKLQEIKNKTEECRLTIDQYNQDLEVLEQDILKAYKEKIIKQLTKKISEIKNDPYLQFYNVKKLELILIKLQDVKDIQALKALDAQWKNLVLQDEKQANERNEMKVLDLILPTVSEVPTLDPSLKGNNTQDWIERIQHLQTQKNTISNFIEDTQQLIDEFNQQLLDPNISIENLTKNSKNIEIAKGTLNMIIDKYHLECKKFKKDSDNYIKEREEEREKDANDLEQKNQLINILNTEKEVLRREKEDLSTQCDNLQEENNKLKVNLEREKAERNGELQVHQHYLSNIELEIKELSKKINTHEGTIQTLIAEKEKLVAQNHVLEHRNNNTEQAQAALNKENDLLNEQNQKIIADLDIARQQLQTALGEKTALEQQLHELQNQNTTLRAENTVLQQQEQRINNTNTILENQNQQLQARLNEGGDIHTDNPHSSEQKGERVIEWNDSNEDIIKLGGTGNRETYDVLHPNIKVEPISCNRGNKVPRGKRMDKIDLVTASLAFIGFQAFYSLSYLTIIPELMAFAQSPLYFGIINGGMMGALSSIVPLFYAQELYTKGELSDQKRGLIRVGVLLGRMGIGIGVESLNVLVLQPFLSSVSNNVMFNEIVSGIVTFVVFVAVISIIDQMIKYAILEKDTGLDNKTVVTTTTPMTLG